VDLSLIKTLRHEGDKFTGNSVMEKGRSEENRLGSICGVCVSREIAAGIKLVTQHCPCPRFTT
jgi:hypothetical protein